MVSKGNHAAFPYGIKLSCRLPNVFSAHLVQTLVYRLQYILFTASQYILFKMYTMKMFLCIALFVVGVSLSTGTPIPEDEVFQFDEYSPSSYLPNEMAYSQILRHTRSADNREIDFHAKHFPDQSGFARGEYNHRLWKDGKAHLDANAYYQRNWGAPGPRQDYGGGLKLTVPLGRH